MQSTERSGLSSEREAVESAFSFTGFDTSTPVVAVALHSGRGLRPDVARRLAVSSADRLREEDPFIDLLGGVVDARVHVHLSRFDVDLNRSEEECVYQEPAEAFGLKPWRAAPSLEQLEGSRAVHRAFYASMRRHLEGLERRFGHFVVLDLHSYNHRRRGPDAPPDDPFANPEINVGTGSMQRQRWAPLVDRFMRDFAVAGQLDVRENVRFVGGFFPSWVHKTFPKTGCALAVGVKKIFMDEWTGQLDPRQLARIRGGLDGSIPGLVRFLGSMR